MSTVVPEQLLQPRRTKHYRRSRIPHPLVPCARIQNLSPRNKVATDTHFANARMDFLHGWICAWMDVGVDGRMDGYMDGCMDGYMDGGMYRWIYAWIYAWMDGWIDGCMDHTV